MEIGLCLHVPCWVQARHHVVPRADHVGWQTTDPVVAIANVVHVGIGNAGPVAANTTRVAAAVGVLESRWRRKVQTGKSAGFTQCMTRVID